MTVFDRRTGIERWNHPAARTELQAKLLHARLNLLLRPLTQELIEAAHASSESSNAVRVRCEPYGRFSGWDRRIDWPPTCIAVRVADYASGSWDRELDRIPLSTAYPGLAERLAATCAALQAIQQQLNDDDPHGLWARLRSDARAIATLRDGTLLGWEGFEKLGVDGVLAALGRNVHDGVTSIGQAVAQLSQGHVEGFDDGRELCRAILDSDVLAELADLLPPNQLGRCAGLASGTPGPLLVAAGDRKLQLTVEFRRILENERVAYRSAVKAGRAGELRGGQAMQGCPLVERSRLRTSDITQLAHVFAERVAVQPYRLDTWRPATTL